MKRGIKLKGVQRHRNFDLSMIVIFIISLLILTGIILIYYSFFDYDVCSTEDCFYSGLVNCDSVSWMRYDEDADWLYKVIGSRGSSCEVEVRLMKIKKGNIDLESLEGKMMVCEVSSTSGYPEEDISMCTGKLKEDLQEVIIKRMHDYILQNLGEIDAEFQRVG